MRSLPKDTAEEEIARQYNIPVPPRQLDLPISYNIVPTQDVLAIGSTRQQSNELWMRAGLIPLA